MSKLTPCNFCTLEGIRYRAEKKGLTVTLLSNQGGLDIYAHPADIEITRELVGNEESETSPYWRAWLMALTDHCVC